MLQYIELTSTAAQSRVGVWQCPVCHATSTCRHRITGAAQKSWSAEDKRQCVAKYEELDHNYNAL